MRTSIKVTSAVVAVGAALVLAPSSGATPTQDGARFGGRVLEFDLGLRDFDENHVDIGTTGPGVGDLLVFQDQVWRKGTHTEIGVQGGSCTVTALLENGFQTHCVGTVSLPRGQISFQGLVTDAPTKLLAIVGGTGAYQAAAGELTFVENGDGTGNNDGTGTLTIKFRRGG
jgi:hypothetical protein